MSVRICLSAAASALLALQALAKEPAREGASIRLEADGLALELVDPAASEASLERGCRFVQAAWIRSVSVQEGSWRWRPLMERSVFSYHPAFGAPEELTPSIKLGDAGGEDSIQLVLGVGRTLRKGSGVFFDRIVEAFPWKVETKDEGAAGALVRFEQSCALPPYGYEFKKSLRLRPSGLIEIECSMENRGSAKLAFESYLHPFLRFEQGPGGYFYAFSRGEEPALPAPELRKALPVNPKTWMTDVFPEDGAEGLWIIAGAASAPERFLAVKTGAKLSKLRFWMKDDCFSVEPFIPLSLEPGAKAEWSWRMRVR